MTTRKWTTKRTVFLVHKKSFALNQIFPFKIEAAVLGYVDRQIQYMLLIIWQSCECKCQKVQENDIASVNVEQYGTSVTLGPQPLPFISSVPSFYLILSCLLFYPITFTLVLLSSEKPKAIFLSFSPTNQSSKIVRQCKMLV